MEDRRNSFGMWEDRRKYMLENACERRRQEVSQYYCHHPQWEKKSLTYFDYTSSRSI